MAVVYRARDTRNGRPVAIKQILPHAAQDPEFLKRFQHEVRIHSQLKHPNVLELYEFGAGPDYYLTMEFVDGGPLSMLLGRTPKFPFEIALFAAREVLNGLACAHQNGIVHRDVKPQNVLINRMGQIKVGDFGISKTAAMTKLTQTGNVIGTPAYMSPEQALGEELDARSDVFSTGVVLYEMLAGKNPFMTDNPAKSMRLIVDHKPPPLFDADPLVPVACDRIVERMLQKNRDHRIPTAEAAAKAIQEVIDSLELKNLPQAFYSFLFTPQPYLEQRKQLQFRRHFDLAKTLITSDASNEAVLWELFQAQQIAPENQETRSLLTQVTQKTGYRLEKAGARPKAQELEAKLQQDPTNIATLLHLAKFHKLEKNFVDMMKYFFRLRGIEVQDPYMAAQIAALVGKASEGQPAAPPQQRPASAAVPPSGRASSSALPVQARPLPVVLGEKPESKVPPLVIAGGILSVVSFLAGLLMLLSP
jgi:serine/threonine protein kinase